MSGQFAIGDRVKLLSGHPYVGETGIVINTPGRVFNGWNVRLDDGHYYVGAADHQMEKLTSVASGPSS